MMKRIAVKAAAKWPTTFFQGGISIWVREAAALVLASIWDYFITGIPRLYRRDLFGGREERGDAVVQGEFHPQAGILLDHLRPHLCRGFRRSGIHVPIGDVLFHEVN